MCSRTCTGGPYCRYWRSGSTFPSGSSSQMIVGSIAGPTKGLSKGLSYKSTEEFRLASPLQTEQLANGVADGAAVGFAARFLQRGNRAVQQPALEQAERPFDIGPIRLREPAVQFRQQRREHRVAEPIHFFG